MRDLRASQSFQNKPDGTLTTGRVTAGKNGIKPAGVKVRPTRRWRKADTNRWSHLRQRC
jgi:hypothetical protein